MTEACSEPSRLTVLPATRIVSIKAPGWNEQSWLYPLAAAVLVVAFFLQSFFAASVKSPTSDEAPHIAAGLAYLQNRDFVPNPEHPPLIKELVGASLLLAGVRLPASQPGSDVKTMLDDEETGSGVMRVGNLVLSLNGVKKVLFPARDFMLILSTLLAVLIWIWGRQIAGNLAGLGALFVYTMDPNVVAHSALVTTDIGMAAFVTLFFFSLWHYLRRPGPARFLFCGVTMGLALCTKYSALVMIPIALPLILLSGGVSGSGARQAGRVLARRALAFAGMCCVAVLVIMAIYFSPAGPSMYVEGLSTIYRGSDPNRLAYLGGQMQPRFYAYFALVWALKEPIGIVVLVLSGSVILLRKTTASLADKLFIFLPSAALFTACTFEAHDIGIRYIIPVIPFACVAAGIALAALIERPSVWSRGAAAVSCVWILVAAAGIYPDHLSYFNEAACLLRDPGKISFDGGSKCGPLWFDDSNVDWGQGLEQLRVWRAAHPDPRPLRLAYFGSFPPRNYGIATEPFGVGPYDRVALPGLYVVSSHIVARYRETWLRTIPPKAIVGHAYYIYDITRLQ